MSSEMDPSVYDADYFLNGVETGKSLYQNYRFLPDLTIPMCKAIAEHCGFSTKHTILDFGCARGYVVKAFHLLGYTSTFGIDCSQWAIENCDPDVKDCLYLRNGTHLNHINGRFDWIIAKDVLEHVPDVQETINRLQEHARVGVFAVVPLSLFDGNPYLVQDYEKDVTHLHRLCLSTWAGMFMKPGWAVTGAYRLRGVKDNYAEWERGNGFITAVRKN